MSKQSNNPLRGIILSRYRNISEAAGYLNMSRFRLASIISGEMSPTVDEVLEMSAACDVPISDVVAASQYMRERYSASQCGPGYCNTEETEKKNDPPELQLQRAVPTKNDSYIRTPGDTIHNYSVFPSGRQWVFFT